MRLSRMQRHPREVHKASFSGRTYMWGENVWWDGVWERGD